jgi:porin
VELLNVRRNYIAAAVMALMSSAPLLAQDDCGENCSPYSLDASYVHDMWRNTRGGLAVGYRHLDYLEIGFQADGAQFNAPQLMFYGSANFTNGESVAGELTGDAQGMSNIEAISAARIGEFWSEWRLAERNSFRTGLYDLSSEFDCIESGALFINSSHGMGIDLSQSGRNGPSTFPATAFAGRLQWALTSQWTLYTAAADGVPGDPDRPKRTTVHLGEGEGALLIAEANRVGTRLRKVGIGTWRYTGKLDHLLETDAEGASAHSVSSGAYVLADVQLYASTAGEGQGLTGFARVGIADKDVNRFDRYTGAGLTYTGIAADDDQLGFGIARARNSRLYREALTLSGSETDAAELNAELTYRFAVNEWLTLQPDLQYVRNPDTNPELRDAFAVGLRFDLTQEFF